MGSAVMSVGERNRELLRLMRAVGVILAEDERGFSGSSGSAYLMRAGRIAERVLRSRRPRRL